MRLVLVKLLLLVFLVFSVAADLSPVDGKADVFLRLHTTKEGKPMRWRECGKRIKDKLARAREYVDAIDVSIEDIEKSTGVRVEYDIVRAILFRESTDNQCAIGNQETAYLTESLGRQPSRRDLIRHVGGWLSAYREAGVHCKGQKVARSGAQDCKRAWVKKAKPHYADIRGWDIGAAQFRWPAAHTTSRLVVLPGETKSNEIDLKSLMRFDISIHMLVQSLAGHYATCNEYHKHWITRKNGTKVRRLPTEDAYYVHHHTGIGSWTQRYWKRIQRHLKKMRIDK